LSTGFLFFLKFFCIKHAAACKQAFPKGCKTSKTKNYPVFKVEEFLPFIFLHGEV